jgi:lipopolysaccharide/colanic/teichoic acid biosynthesis glycosyltransferase
MLGTRGRHGAPGRPGHVSRIHLTRIHLTRIHLRRDRIAVDTGPGIPPGAPRRLLDIAVAGGALLVLWPAFLFVAAAAMVSTGGFPIYRQRRIGQGGVPFTLLKFRTMRARMPGPEVTPPGDPRVTRFGALLRRTSIDELPQMVNVLLGHMTLVGPRPESVALAVRYPQECRFVFRYRPGLTGPSQVLEHDDWVLRQVPDAEGFYLSDLVPRRVATDLTFLERPSFGQTVLWLVNTLRYLTAGVPAGLAGSRVAGSPAVTGEPTAPAGPPVR